MTLTNTPALELILAERVKQRASGFDEANNDNHKHGELARAGVAYALAAEHQARGYDVLALAHMMEMTQIRFWPFEKGNFKPKTDRVQNLATAAALLIAEMEREMRLKGEAK